MVKVADSMLETAKSVVDVAKSMVNIAMKKSPCMYSIGGVIPPHASSFSRSYKKACCKKHWVPRKGHCIQRWPQM
jgi:hypothetical protein